MSRWLLLTATGLAFALACGGGAPPDAPPPATKAPPAAAPAPTPPPPAPEAPSKATDGSTLPAGGCEYQEVIYTADGQIWGCVGGGNWCGKTRPPKTNPCTGGDWATKGPE